MKLFIKLFFIFSFFIFPSISFGEIKQEYVKATVLEIVDSRAEEVGFGETSVQVQKIKLEIDGGKKIEIESDLGVLEAGDKLFLLHQTGDGENNYSVRDIDRTFPILFLFLFFIVTVIFFGKKQGWRSLLSLLISFLILVYVFIPVLLAGHSPVYVGLPIIIFLLALVIYFTHGFSKKSHIAILGTGVSLIVTAIISAIFISQAKLSGFFSDESAFLDVATDGNLDMKGLLFAGIVIGIIGILDDIAITQVSVVSEMKNLKQKISKKEIWKKSMSVGRHHIGALINTLVLAYVGVSLPLIMYLFQTGNSFSFIINQEPLATEIARTLIGSIGLIITVPITTYLAISFLPKEKK